MRRWRLLFYAAGRSYLGTERIRSLVRVGGWRIYLHASCPEELHGKIVGTKTDDWSRKILQAR